MLADDAFSDAIFYLDTNIVLDAVMTEESARSFREVVTASKSIGIDLRVTDATLEEAERVASQRVHDMDIVINTVPNKLIERTTDRFFWAFQTARTADPEITPYKFLDRFKELPNLLRDLSITHDKRIAEDIARGHQVKTGCKIISNAAERVRGRAKTDRVSLHDMCHFIVIRELREKDRKAWFLTRDRTLSHAATKLAPSELPFCFPFVAFLQSVSPFVETPTTRHTLVDVFSAILEGEVGDLSGHSLFDMTELRLLAELHTDVLSLPTDQLLPALEYVKSNLLNGKPYRREDHTSVALELRKFLVSSANAKQAELMAQLADHRELSVNAKRDSDDLRNEVLDLKGRVTVAETRIEARERTTMKLSVALALLGVVIATICWWFDLDIAERITSAVQSTYIGPESISLLTRVIGALVFVGSFIPMLFHTLKGNLRVLGLTIIIAVAIGASNFFGLSSLKAISALLAVASPIALMILYLSNGIPKDR